MVEESRAAEAARTLSQQTQASITSRLDDIAVTTLSNVSRIVRVAFTDGGIEELVLTVVLQDGRTMIADRAYPDDQTLGISVTSTTASSVGSRDELLDDAFVAGTLTVERMIPDDFRLAPLLEALFEVLVDTGVLERTEGERVIASVPIAPKQ